ncbi:MAG: efflux RND transporter periplasmic adaptor subunit [Archangium sp.]
MNRVLLFSALLLVACNKGEGEGGPPAEPPVTVQAMTLEQHPVEDTSDYLASLISRKAVNLHPQIQGYVRAINVTPGATVKAGTVLVSIDAQAETASLQNLVATRESQVVSAKLARERLERATNLRTDGIVSQQDADAARAAADGAEASLRATDALIASQRARVGFFSIVAPFDGVVGNFPVKVGDFVQSGTPITSLTADAGLEAEVWVPVEKAKSLTPTSLVRLVGSDGKRIAESPVVFVSQRADPSSQLVLIKAAFASAEGLRADQLIRGRVVWNASPGLTIPAAAIQRQAGQAFAYTVGGEGAAMTATRVPVTLGALQGREYVVVGGLEAGQRVVVQGVQHLHDGSVVKLTGTN